jgi:hydroxyacylglutathione hydrolase
VIHQLKLRISNAYLVVGTKAILVDTGCPGDACRIVRALERRRVDLRDVAAIVHTHGHWDHCGSTADLRRRTEIPAAIHVADAPMLRSGRNATLRPTTVTGRLALPFVSRPFEPVEPDVLLNEGFDLRQFGLAAAIVPTPGHTAGSVSVLFKTGEVIVGDLLMGGFLGGVLLPAWPRYPLFADDLEQVRASVENLLSLGARRFYLGHGGPLDYNQVLIRLSITAPRLAHPAPASI